MIVSFSRRFVFVAVPRTGTHSMRQALRPLLARTDWEQCGLHEPRTFPVPQLAAIRHGHISAGEIQPYLIPGLWAQMFSFAVVRNPYDRFVSCCAFLNRGRSVLREDPVGLMNTMLDRRHEHLLMWPQHEFVCDADGKPMVSFIARYEQLASDFETIRARIGGPEARLDRVNHSPREGLTLDDALRARVREAYARDFSLLGYSPDAA